MLRPQKPFIRLLPWEPRDWYWYLMEKKTLPSEWIKVIPDAIHIWLLPTGDPLPVLQRFLAWYREQGVDPVFLKGGVILDGGDKYFTDPNKRLAYLEMAGDYPQFQVLGFMDQTGKADNGTLFHHCPELAGWFEGPPGRRNGQDNYGKHRLGDHQLVTDS